MVRARWAEMRARAMAEGRPYRFAVTENTGKFRVAPDDDAYWSARAASEDDDKPLIVEGELPEGVLFTTSETAFAGVERRRAGAGMGPGDRRLSRRRHRPRRRQRSTSAKPASGPSACGCAP